jgi:hypothetical protein
MRRTDGACERPAGAGRLGASEQSQPSRGAGETGAKGQFGVAQNEKRGRAKRQPNWSSTPGVTLSAAAGKCLKSALKMLRKSVGPSMYRIGGVTFRAFSSPSGFSTLLRFRSIFETAAHCRL